ncbi:MAG: hypothetical protein H7Y59_10735 [Anaerolineales bacterium]|nr:hypothetical protein [Anaerolineales bacterium]
MAKKNSRPNRSTPIVNIPAQRTEFNPDYTHVKKDLKRIGILAATFFVGLIVLSFFIN